MHLFRPKIREPVRKAGNGLIIRNMRMRKLIYSFLMAVAATAVLYSQEQGTIKREVTLYNPYKPSIPDAVKKSSLPDLTDTTRVRPSFSYDVNIYPYMPSFTISPIKPATMVPDLLPKLYKSYINAGIGNFFTPLAEISISNERSKKQSVGIYASHFSTNSKVQLQNMKKGYAGYADNDLMLYGNKFMKKHVLGGVIDFSHRSRFAYGYDTVHTAYDPSKKSIRSDFYNAGAAISLKTLDTDSSKLSYSSALRYDLFLAGNSLFQHSFGLSGSAEKNIKEFYAGTGFEITGYSPSDSVASDGKYYVALSPHIEKRKNEWHVRLGLEAVLDKNYGEDPVLKVYPDLKFGFNIIPDYLKFFAELGGRMERNEPMKMLGINPFIYPADAGIFKLPNTSYSLAVKAGLGGESGLGYVYRIYGSYSIADDFLLFTNYNLSNGASTLSHGNYFLPLADQAEILNIHAETGGSITGKLSYEASGGYWKYTLAESDEPWGLPAWDANLKLKYNLRDKILANAGLSIGGKRKELITYEDIDPLGSDFTKSIELPAKMFINLGAEYRFTNILSFWTRFDNISFTKQYERAFYPTRRFLFLAGFTYSL
jgi:hypothetical protein